MGRWGNDRSTVVSDIDGWFHAISYSLIKIICCMGSRGGRVGRA
jgi:hypothetical protein